MTPDVFVVLLASFTIKSRLRIARDGKSVAPECLSPTPNLADLIALEQALRLREHGLVSRVICIAGGSQIADEILSHSIAMGADRAIRFKAGADLYADARESGQRVAAIIASFGGKLVFTGGGSSDGDGDVNPHMVAAGLDATCLTNAMDLELSGDKLRVERRIEKGHRQIWATHLPAVVAFDPSAVAPRYVPVAAHILARRAPTPVREPDQDELEPATALSKFIAPRIRPKRISAVPSSQSVAERMQAVVTGGLGETKTGTVLSGPPDQVADQIVAFLEQRGLLEELA